MLRFNLNRDILAAGELGIFDISNEVSVRFVVENAAVGNIFLVSGRIIGQSTWDSIDSLVGSTNEVLLVDTYDEIKITCSVYSSSGSSVRIIACSFDR